jgi:hypothetical protein
MLEEPNNFMATIAAAAANAMSGNLDLTRSAMGRACELVPNLHLQKIKDRLHTGNLSCSPYGRTPCAKAGLPE